MVGVEFSLLTEGSFGFGDRWQEFSSPYRWHFSHGRCVSIFGQNPPVKELCSS